MTNTTESPPGGFPYREPSVSWVVQPYSELAMKGLDAVAEALSIVRAQNPSAGLNSGLAACLEAIKQYQCARLKTNKRLLWKFCSEISPLPESLRRKYTPPPSKKKKCAGCGGRR